MADKKLTDNDIIKALKECLTEPCSEQAYINAVRNALDLINRKNVEIDFVKSSRNLAEASVNTLKAELDLAKAFHKEAVSERDLLNIQLRKAKAENEALYKINAQSTEEISELRKELCKRQNLEESFSKSVKQAVKEVVKQLEAEVESSDKYIREYEDTEKQRYWNIGLRHALKVVKRMVGGSSDKKATSKKG